MVSYNDLSILVFALVMILMSKIATQMEMKRLATTHRPNPRLELSAADTFLDDSTEDTNG